MFARIRVRRMNLMEDAQAPTLRGPTIQRVARNGRRHGAGEAATTDGVVRTIAELGASVRATTTVPMIGLGMARAGLRCHHPRGLPATPIRREEGARRRLSVRGVTSGLP